MNLKNKTKDQQPMFNYLLSKRLGPEDGKRPHAHLYKDIPVKELFPNGRSDEFNAEVTQYGMNFYQRTYPYSKSYANMSQCPGILDSYYHKLRLLQVGEKE
jgi:hypothetical protein